MEKKDVGNNSLITILNSVEEEEEDYPSVSKRSYVSFIGSGSTPISSGSNLPDHPGPFSALVFQDMAIQKATSELKFELASQLHQAHLAWQVQMAAFMNETVNSLDNSLEFWMATLAPRSERKKIRLPKKIKERNKRKNSLGIIICNNTF